MRIDTDSIVSPAADVVACALGDSAALLDLRSSSYFSLNPVAAFVWERLAAPTSLANLVDGVRTAFDVGDADVAQDMIAVVRSLAAADLVSVRNPPDA